MTENSRRDVLKSVGTFSFVTLAGTSSPASAQSEPKPLFPVKSTFIPIIGSDHVFPVRRIYCIGRNYAAHAREMGSDPSLEPPFFFQKPSDAIQNVKIG